MAGHPGGRAPHLKILCALLASGGPSQASHAHGAPSRSREGPFVSKVGEKLLVFIFWERAYGAKSPFMANFIPYPELWLSHCQRT